MPSLLRAFPRTWAVLLAGLWLVGFDVLPWAHIAFHEAFGEHRHSANEALVHFAEHDHEAAHHHDHEASPRHHHEAAHADSTVPTEPESPHEPSAPAREHGRGSLAHRNLAAPPAQLVLPPVSEARIASTEARPFMFEDDPSRVDETATRARAPPRMKELFG